MTIPLAPALLVLAAAGLTAAPWDEAGRARPSAATRADSAPPPTPLEHARSLERARDWTGLAAFLGERARRVDLPPEEQRLLALACEGLGRLDEAAHHLDLAVAGWQRLGRETDEKAALAALRRVEPLSARRDPFVRKVTSTLAASAQDLLDGGDPERALRIAQGLPRLARGKEARSAAELLERAQAAFRRVEIARPGSPAAAGAPLPLVERESEHYLLACHLEPDVVERLGRLMDDVHSFYVRVYFDGDVKRARAAKASIRIAPDKQTMLRGWQGAGEPEGWWSPGSNEVHSYDTRSSTRSLDDMLETLFHEASHQFMSLLAGTGRVPAWLNEGTSSFFEGTVALADGRVLWPRAAERRLEVLVRQIASRQAPRLRDVVEYAGAGSYAAEYYAWGWGLVYYLLEYEDPATLEQVYRPLYAQYRDEVVRRGTAPFEAFEGTFLGARAPRNHPDFASFERDWERWILDEVAPLHGRGAPARALRLARIERLIAAAEAASGARQKRGARPEELLERALVHFEWIRTRIDADQPDPELLLRQADVLERLTRQASAAALIEDVLDLAARGRFTLDEARRSTLEKRVARLDRRNAALRSARRRTSELSRTALALVEDYRDAGLVLRAFTLASDLASVLDEPLAAAAAELRAEARTRGLLRGTIRELSTGAGAWQPLLAVPPERFETSPEGAVLAGVRAVALVDTSFEAGVEYVVRARIQPLGERVPGATFGLVASGAPERGATLIGVDDAGLLGVWTLNAAPRGASTLRRTRTIPLAPAIAAGAAVELGVRVRADGALEIEIDATRVAEARLESGPAQVRHAGIFVRNAHARFEDARVELVP
ncbi:MAG: DUF1570 domain-containing protein [Planctomycetes bacterium]|nr:DUF1570 domain-containing protein [Planctomycetota bacterium]